MQHHCLERDIYFPFYKITSVKLIRFAHEKKLRMSYLMRNSQLILFTALGLAKLREDKNIFFIEFRRKTTFAFDSIRMSGHKSNLYNWKTLSFPFYDINQKTFVIKSSEYWDVRICFKF